MGAAIIPPAGSGTDRRRRRIHTGIPPSLDFPNQQGSCGSTPPPHNLPAFPNRTQAAMTGSRRRVEFGDEGDGLGTKKADHDASEAKEADGAGIAMDGNNLFKGG
ncbi:uncharacterized protein ACBT44_019564 isoform 1-T3 [Syngnathus typhle]